MNRTGYFIKRINMTAGRDITMIGKRFLCGERAEPYDSMSSAERALKQQEKQDNELCPDSIILYEIVKG